MYTPLLIDFDYQIIHSASGQIARVFWEHQDKLKPIIVCSEQSTELTSNNKLIKVKEQVWIRRTLSLFRVFGLPDLCHIPDQRRFSWKPFALKAINMGHYQFDYIQSISCPESSHMIALEVKKRTGKPWIAQFNDPWVENEVKHFRTRYFHTIDSQLEKEVAENADLIIHSNKVIFEDWQNRYGSMVSEKMIILPFSFNISQLPTVDNHIKRAQKLKIYHIGHIYGQRSARPILQALCELKKESPTIYNQIELTFIGSFPNNDKAFVQQSDLLDCVHFHGTLPPEKLVEYYLDSDIFLVIDMNVPRSPSYPSKLMLYHYYRRPILSITPPDSIIRDDMFVSGHNSYSYDDINGIKQYLCKAVSNYQSLLSFDHNHWKQFTVDNVSSLYYKEVMKVLSK